MEMGTTVRLLGVGRHGVAAHKRKYYDYEAKEDHDAANTCSELMPRLSGSGAFAPGLGPTITLFRFLSRRALSAGSLVRPQGALKPWIGFP